MKIFAIEGLDKSGKHTQSELLADRLKEAGYKVIKSEFHRYDTPTGALIRDWLTGRWDISQIGIELIMSADKIAQQKWFDQLADEGYDALILDRYTLSQEVYARASNVSEDLVNELQMHMRQPDWNIVIDIPAEVSMARKGKHNGGVNDRYESDLSLLKRIRENYLKARGSFIINGELPVEDIHERIYSFVHGNLSGKLER